MNPFSIHVVNDVDDIKKSTVLEKVKENSLFSVSYITLLLTSTIICTLGLLLNSAPIVIGGMIIAPLMWPLMKVSSGISVARKSFIAHGITLFLGSVLISLATAYILTFISPIKVVNAEILSRTQPTLLDIFIALAAGVVATLALIHKKISSSFAGVAIATSLMPPLCVSGIGFALADFSVASGSLLLFVANTVSIIFVSIFVFRFVGITSKTHNELRRESILFVSIMLAITALPLFIFLKDYSFKSQAYQQSNEVLSETFTEIAPEIVIENVKTSLGGARDSGAITITADILVPEGVSIDLEQQELIIEELENELGRKVELNLRIQEIIALKSKSDQQVEQDKLFLQDTFKKFITDIDSSLAIDTISTSLNEEEVWLMQAVLRSDPSIVFTEAQRSKMEERLTKTMSKPVQLSLEIVPRIKLRAETDTIEKVVEEDIREYFRSISEEIDITSYKFTREEEFINVKLDIQTPETIEISNAVVRELKRQLTGEYDDEIVLTINELKKQSFTY